MQCDGQRQNGNRCKRHITHPSGTCHLHRRSPSPAPHCPICFGEDARAMCKVYCCGFEHMHVRCLRAWLRGGANRTCPMCRQEPLLLPPRLRRALAWALALWCTHEQWLPVVRRAWTS